MTGVPGKGSGQDPRSWWGPEEYQEVPGVSEKLESLPGQPKDRGKGRRGVWAEVGAPEVPTG